MILWLFVVAALAQDPKPHVADLDCDSVLPASIDFGWHGGKEEIVIADKTGCTWIVQAAGETASWITVHEPNSGTGVSGMVTIQASVNDTAKPRTGTVRVSYKTVLVTQPCRKCKP